MGQQASVYGALGVAFAATDCAAEAIRGTSSGPQFDHVLDY